MKTNLLSRFAISLAFFSAILFLVNTTAQAKPVLTEMIKYKNTWIPKVSLKEVTITAKAVNQKKKVLCSMIKYQHSLIPFVQLNEINVTPSGNYVSLINPSKRNLQAHLLEARLVNGKYMPHVNLNEVTIVAYSDIALENGSSSDNQNIDVRSQVSLRKSFDRLANFLVSQSKTYLKKMLPGWFAA